MIGLLHKKQMREFVGLVALAVTGALLHRAGWPWWAWLPAALLAGFAGAAAVVLSWFETQKRRYEAEAAKIKEQLRLGEIEP